MDNLTVFLTISLILFFGYIAELIFKKLRVPDVLILIIVGFLIGPSALDLVQPSSLAELAPFFTTFTLLFLLFDGAFNLDLSAFAKGFTPSILISHINFFGSSLVTLVILMLFGYDFLTALMTGLLLGGISSAFVIPIVKQLAKKDLATPILTIESAITDVFAIVFALTVMQLIELNTVAFQIVLSKLVALFAVAGLIGIIGGILWVLLINRVFERAKSYMMTVAFLLLLFVITEYLHGNGAIAGLFFGFMLRNSHQILYLFKLGTEKKVESAQTKVSQKEKERIDEEISHLYTHTAAEKFFYDQISFLLKVFFFVYIGILFDITNTYTLFVGGIISIAIMIVRYFSTRPLKNVAEHTRSLVGSVFGRGLAPAAIILIAVQKKIPHAQELTGIVYMVIVATIVLSSISLLLIKPELAPEPVAPKKK